MNTFEVGGEDDTEFQDKHYLSWTEYDKLVDDVCSKINKKTIKNVYGIPNGGVISAYLISKKLNIPFIIKETEIKEGTLIIDDVADSGKDLFLFENYTTAVIVLKDWCEIKPTIYALKTKKWVVLPYDIKTYEDRCLRTLIY